LRINKRKKIRVNLCKSACPVKFRRTSVAYLTGAAKELNIRGKKNNDNKASLIKFNKMKPKAFISSLATEHSSLRKAIYEDYGDAVWEKYLQYPGGELASALYSISKNLPKVQKKEALQEALKHLDKSELGFGYFRLGFRRLFSTPGTVVQGTF